MKSQANFYSFTLCCCAHFVPLASYELEYPTTEIKPYHWQVFQDPQSISDPINPPDVAHSNQITQEDVTDRIEKLQKYLTQTRWTGQFTVSGQEEKPPTSEYYEIVEATKAEEGDYWNLIARIKYGDKDTTLPLPPIEIKWAGETPVITVDRVTIPGMGTFDARVLIRKGQYAGTWSHDNVGGHLFGKIEKIEKTD